MVRNCLRIEVYLIVSHRDFCKSFRLKESSSISCCRGVIITFGNKFSDTKLQKGYVGE